VLRGAQAAADAALHPPPVRHHAAVLAPARPVRLSLGRGGPRSICFYGPRGEDREGGEAFRCDRLPACENHRMLVESGFQFGVYLGMKTTRTNLYCLICENQAVQTASFGRSVSRAPAFPNSKANIVPELRRLRLPPHVFFFLVDDGF
jgi:hypothetical protein